MNSVKKRRRAVVDQAACVACGCCVKVCPLQAIRDRPGHHGPGQSGEVRGLRQVRQGVSRPASSRSGRWKHEKALV